MRRTAHISIYVDTWFDRLFIRENVHASLTRTIHVYCTYIISNIRKLEVSFDVSRLY